MEIKIKISKNMKGRIEMDKKSGMIVAVIAALALCLSVVSMGLILRGTPERETGDIQYVLYLGTNDKDSNEPVYAPDEAKIKASEILINHFGGYTIQEANGGWTDENGVIFQEYTIVIYLSDTTLEQVHAAADSLIDAFHQSSVLIQANATRTEFYSGVES